MSADGPGIADEDSGKVSLRERRPGDGERSETANRKSHKSDLNLTEQNTKGRSGSEGMYPVKCGVNCGCEKPCND